MGEAAALRAARRPRPRTVATWANIIGRVWLLAAAGSLGLPSVDRLGIWLPLHLALAGAATTTISGNVQMFAGALTASQAPRASIAFTQLGLVGAGALMVAVGLPAGHPALIAAGGVCSGAGILLLGFIVLGAWRRGLNRRHGLPLALYGAALASALAGGAIGAGLGSGAVHDPLTYLALRGAHLVLSLLGFVSLTIAGTMLTLVPTILRVRLTAQGSHAAAGSLVAGTAALTGGFILRSRPLAAVGGVAYAAGAVLLVGTAVAAVRAMRGRQGAPPPIAAAAHLLLGLLWFCAGAIALGAAAVAGAVTEEFLSLVLAVFVLGWTVQVLLGAWSYLVPSTAPAGAGDRRAFLAAMDAGALAQVVAFNVGLLAVALRAAGMVPGAVGRAGAWIALIAGVVALARTWLFRRGGRTRWAERRVHRVFGP